MLIRIGSRKSDLARIQAYAVGTALQQIDNSIEIEYHFSASMGDKNLTDPLWKAPEQGIFTQDLFKDLVNNKTDLNVHSWKDLPTESNDLTHIVATLPRENAHDMLLLKKSSTKKIQTNKQITIASSSPRRIYNIGNFLPSLLPWADCKIIWKDVRGNIQTRLKKVFEQDYDGIIVAKAAIDRLIHASQEEFQETKLLVKSYLDQCNWMLLPLNLNPPAAAQGALAIEIRRNDNQLYKLLQKLNHQSTFDQIQKERELHSSYGGGCHQKLGITYQQFSFGEILAKRGELDSCGKINHFNLTAFSPLPEQINSHEFYPNSNDTAIFDRKELKISTSKLNQLHLLVSKAIALPSTFIPTKEQIIWTAGLTTWKKLAQRGIWVNGSNEGLSDELRQTIDFRALTSKPTAWAKLTHTTSPQEFSTIPIIPTYQLERNNSTIEWQQKKICYWKSGSTFLQALKEYPDIINAKHICGPGITYQMLCQYLTPQQIIIDLNFQQFIKKYINEKE